MTDADTHTYYETHAASYGNVAPHGAFVEFRSEFIRQLAERARVLDPGCGLQPNGLLCASFKAATSDWRDDEGRLYGAMDQQKLRHHCARLACQVQTLYQRQGLTNPTTTWLWLFARKLP